MKKLCSLLLTVFVLLAPIHLSVYAVDENNYGAKATRWEDVREWAVDKFGSAKDWFQSTQVYNHNYQNDLERLKEWSHSQYANAKDWFSTTSVYNYDYQQKWKDVKESTADTFGIAKGWAADKFGSAKIWIDSWFSASDEEQN